MKIAYPLLFICISFFSCQKEKIPSIIGSWEQIAEYMPDGAGQFSWIQFTDTYPYRLTLTGEGQYHIEYRCPLGAGNYQYDPVSRQLKFIDPATGVFQISPVSLLDESYLIIDHVSTAGSIYVRKKYLRKEY